MILIGPALGGGVLAVFGISSFLLVLVIDSFNVSATLGHPPLVERIVLIPLIAGIPYELVQRGASTYLQGFVRVLLPPDLAVQRLTTRKLDALMLEVPIVALMKVLTDEDAPLVVTAPEASVPSTS